MEATQKRGSYDPHPVPSLPRHTLPTFLPPTYYHLHPAQRAHSESGHREAGYLESIFRLPKKRGNASEITDIGEERGFVRRKGAGGGRVIRKAQRERPGSFLCDWRNLLFL